MGTEAQAKYPPLAEIAIETLGRKTKAYLAGLCRSEGLPEAGLKSELIERLTAAKHGGAAGYVPGKTLCRYCGAPVKVTKTVPQEMGDGRILITRQLRCEGRNRHSYPVKEIRAAKQQPLTAESAEI